MELSTAIAHILPIDTAVQDAIRKITRRQTLPKGFILLHKGETLDEVHYIEEGLVRAFYYNDRKEITSWMANEGRFIWPLPSYLLRQPSRETIQLLEPTTVLTMSRHDLETLKQTYDVFNDLQCRIMQRYLILYDLRIQILLLKSEDRLEAFQKTFPDLHQRVPLRYIATYLGIDPATLSRLRGNYRKKLKTD